MRLSRSIFAALLLAIAAALSASLWPQPLELPDTPRVSGIPTAQPGAGEVAFRPYLTLNTPAPDESPAPAPPPPPPPPQILASTQVAPIDTEPTVSPGHDVNGVPYLYLGRMRDGTRQLAFLALGDDNFAIGVGETIADEWQLNAIEPSRLTFLHIPSQTVSMLEIASP